MPRDIDIHALYNSIKKDIELAQALLGLLQQTRKALESRHYDALPDLNQQQMQHFEALELNQQARDKLQHQAGMPTGLQGLKALLADLGPHPTLDRPLAELEALAKHLSHENLINAKILSLSHAQSNRVLELVTQGAHSNTYAPDAQFSSTPLSRPLTKA